MKFFISILITFMTSFIFSQQLNIDTVLSEYKIANEKRKIEILEKIKKSVRKDKFKSHILLKLLDLEKDISLIEDISILLGKIKISRNTLAKLLKHKNEYVRYCAAYIVKCHKESKSFIDDLILCLDDESSFVREGVCENLGSIGEKACKAIPKLIKCAKEDSFIDVSTSAICALGHIKDKKALKFLIGSLENKNIMSFKCIKTILAKNIRKRYKEKAIILVKGSVIIALGNMGEKAKQAIPILIDGLNESERLKCEIIESLGKIGIPSEIVIGSLIKEIENTDIFIRISVIKSLGQLGSDLAVPALISASMDKKNKNLRDYIAESLGKIGSPKALPCLKEISKDKNKDISEAAIRAINMISKDF